MSDTNQFTNLAGEFYILSVLNRLHIENYLTLGNKKGVDIVCFYNEKRFNIEVKAVMSGDWMIGANDPTTNINEDCNKFYIFARIGDTRNERNNKLSEIECFILPECDIIKHKLFLKHPTKGYFLHYPRKNAKGGQYRTKEEEMRCSNILLQYRNKWDLLKT